jgi:hypothetical protein
MACSPPPTPRAYYTFGDSHPGGEERLLVNGAVLLTGQRWETEGEYIESFEQVLKVTVTDVETGASVPGELMPWWGAPNGVAWLPKASLLPNRRYELVGTLPQTAPRPSGAQGATEFRKTFTTSDQVASPLGFLGMARIQLEAFERDRLYCSPSLCTCEKDGREISTRAHIQVPGVQGGALPGAYRFEFWVTDKTPFRFDEPNQHLEHEVLWGTWGVNSSGLPTETDFELPRNDSPYVPCFSYRVVDPAGNTLEGEPVCMKGKIDPPGDEEGGLGCAAGPARGSFLGLALLVLLGASMKGARRLRLGTQ